MTDYLLALQPLLKLHSKLLGSVCPGSHDAGPGVHSLERETALLVHLSHHRVKRWRLSLKIKASLHWRPLCWVRLPIQSCLLIHQYCCFLALEGILFGLQSLALKQTQNNELHLGKQPKSNALKVKSKVNIYFRIPKAKSSLFLLSEVPWEYYNYTPSCWHHIPGPNNFTPIHTQIYWVK